MARSIILLALLFRQTLAMRASDQISVGEPGFCKNIKSKCSNFQVEKCPTKCGELLTAFCTNLEESKKASSSKCNTQERRQCTDACTAIAQHNQKSKGSAGESHVCKSIQGGCTEFQAERCPEKCAKAYCNNLAVDLPLAQKMCLPDQLKKCPTQCAQVKKDACDALGAELSLTNRKTCKSEDKDKCPEACAKAICGALPTDLPTLGKVCDASEKKLCGEICDQVQTKTCSKVANGLILAKQTCEADNLAMCPKSCKEVKNVFCGDIASFLTTSGMQCDATQKKTCAEECAQVSEAHANAPPESSKSCTKITTFCNRFYEELCPIKCKKVQCGQMQQKHTNAGTKCNSREKKKCPQACKNAENAECGKIGSEKTATGEFCNRDEKNKCKDVCANVLKVSCNMLGNKLAQTGRKCTTRHRDNCPAACNDVDSTFETEEEGKHVCTKIIDSCNFFQKKLCAKKCARMECDKTINDLQQWNQPCTPKQESECPGNCAQLKETLGVADDVEEDLDDMAFCKSVTSAPCGAFHARECPKKCTLLKCKALGKTLAAAKKPCNSAQQQLCPGQCKNANSGMVCENIRSRCNSVERKKCKVKCRVYDR